MYHFHSKYWTNANSIPKALKIWIIILKWHTDWADSTDSNILDTQHEFIFELESEELIGFFNELASQAGVDLKNFEDEDVTFEWREF